MTVYEEEMNDEKKGWKTSGKEPVKNKDLWTRLLSALEPHKVDFIWDIDMINENDIYEIADFNYLWAQDVDEPLVAIENIRINNETIKFLGSGGNTLRISVNNIGFLKFNLKPEEKAVLDPGSGCYVMDIVGRCARNIFNNTTSP